MTGNREGNPGDDRGPAPGPDRDQQPAAPEEDPLTELTECLEAWGFAQCFQPIPDEDDTAAPVAPAGPTVTMTDLAQFAPDPMMTSVEPGNIGIAGMPANFIATAMEHTRTGTLFGDPITVTFTPVAYDYTYGDGETASISSPGRTWADLGQAQFTATPTSHIYDAPGLYLADIDVRYSARVDFGTGSFAVSGQLTTDGLPQQIRVYSARTALVARTCAESPGAAGC